MFKIPTSSYPPHRGTGTKVSREAAFVLSPGLHCLFLPSHTFHTPCPYSSPRDSRILEGQDCAVPLPRAHGVRRSEVSSKQRLRYIPTGTSETSGEAPEAGRGIPSWRPGQGMGAPATTTSSGWQRGRTYPPGVRMAFPTLLLMSVSSVRLYRWDLALNRNCQGQAISAALQSSSRLGIGTRIASPSG